MNDEKSEIMTAAAEQRLTRGQRLLKALKASVMLVDDQTSPPATMKQRSVLFGMTAVILVLDQLSKYFIETYLPLYDSWAPIPAFYPFVRILHTTNTGAAFGLFQAGGGFFSVMAVIVAFGIIYANHTLPNGYISLRVALGFALGGALGNLVDRIRLGHVTDFISVGSWPVFNLADAAIVTGVILLAWFTMRNPTEIQPTLTVADTIDRSSLISEDDSEMRSGHHEW